MHLPRALVGIINMYSSQLANKEKNDTQQQNCSVKLFFKDSDLTNSTFFEKKLNKVCLWCFDPMFCF